MLSLDYFCLIFLLAVHVKIDVVCVFHVLFKCSVAGPNLKIILCVLQANVQLANISTFKQSKKSLLTHPESGMVIKLSTASLVPK